MCMYISAQKCISPLLTRLYAKCVWVETFIRLQVEGSLANSIKTGLIRLAGPVQSMCVCIIVTAEILAVGRPSNHWLITDYFP